MFVGPRVFTWVRSENRQRAIFSEAEEDPQVLRYSQIPPVRTDANGRFTLTGIDPRELVPKQTPELDAKGRPKFVMEKRYEINAYSPPGMNYRWGTIYAESQADLVIECRRGIPYQLKIVDEAGAPVDAEIESFPIMPNPFVRDAQRYATHSHEPISLGIRRGPGVYEGFVEPGPGAVLVDAGAAVSRVRMSIPKPSSP